MLNQALENTAKRVAFSTLGCKLNFAETSTISRQFLSKGYILVSFEEKADIYVINTCSVTSNADQELPIIVRRALKKNPGAFIIAMGCYAQLKPYELANIKGVDMVFGTNYKFKILDYIHNIFKTNLVEIHSCDIEDVNSYVGSYSLKDRSRTFLKIQDGCDYKCSYCTIPLARGKSRSDRLENVIRNAREIAMAGVKEIVLTGVNIGDYGKVEIGHKKYDHSLLELLQSLDKVETIERFRISSIEPNLLNSELIDFIAKSRKIAPHFHIPLQSGSNYILKKMRRRYLRELYAEKIYNIKSLMPHACIGSDVIVGFPSETDKHFMETFLFLTELEISYLHVFTYSERINTKSVLMEGFVPKHIRSKRNHILRGLSFKKQMTFYESQIGSSHTVIFENEDKQGFLYGYTENYIKVKAKLHEFIPNSVSKIRLKSIDRDGIMLIE